MFAMYMYSIQLYWSVHIPVLPYVPKVLLYRPVVYSTCIVAICSQRAHAAASISHRRARSRAAARQCPRQQMAGSCSYSDRNCSHLVQTRVGWTIRERPRAKPEVLRSNPGASSFFCRWFQHLLPPGAKLPVGSSRQGAARR